MKSIVLFVLSYILVLFIYEVFIVKRAIKNKDDKDKKEPIEVRLLVKKYKIDIKKINYNKLLHIIALISSLDIAIVASVITLFDNLILQIIIGLVLGIVLIFVSYDFIGKKMKKNE